MTAAWGFTASTFSAKAAVAVAVAVARGIIDILSGIRAADLPGFVVVELAGAVLATLFFGWLFADEQKPAEQEEKA